ncbi:Protein kinase domain-containing protein [Mycena sanguinolenta]|uniref:Protein kinase domain-containing protein n=1 Tax=Mycena sanguinolenta TaxID=230812 RepID=A0A8H6Y040_9AGAR|nr:Protein kinase domain-containing protein [Mycena sanguinolenta]
MASPFVFSVAEDVEDDRNYQPGGLFPVKVGDSLGPEGSTRYRIVAKLGYGSYSTVWLARDLVAKRTVAVKIVRASETETSREAAILERLRVSPPLTDPAVLQLLDSFKVTSANGTHQVLVTELAIRLTDVLKLPRIEVNTRNIVRQVLEGLAFIHERGVVHGDLYPDNIGATVDLDSLSEIDIWERCGPPTIVPLVAYDPARDAASFPPHLTYGPDLDGLWKKGFTPREPHVRILDLGCAYLAEQSPSPRCHTPRAYMAPEVLFPTIAHDNRDAQWDWRADIWAMGCTICTIARGGVLFHGGFTVWTRWPDAVEAHQRIGWPISRQFRTKSNPKVFYTPEAADALWATTLLHLQRWGQTAEDAQGLVALLRRMLVIDPMERPTASELLKDPYLISTTTLLNENVSSSI